MYFNTACRKTGSRYNILNSKYKQFKKHWLNYKLILFCSILQRKTLINCKINLFFHDFINLVNVLIIIIYNPFSVTEIQLLSDSSGLIFSIFFFNRIQFGGTTRCTQTGKTNSVGWKKMYASIYKARGGGSPILEVTRM